MRLLLLVVAAIVALPSHAWLSPQTRREMFGTAWTTLCNTALVVDPTTASPEHPMIKNNVKSASSTTNNNKDDEKQSEKQRQKEHDRLARETKARLAAGRIGTI